ncbi:hypothetical protein JW960_18000 [candidate division KSB1 bacterium]|nr:hypothetical protein [candidate division KSB1 bacterium]
MTYKFHNHKKPLVLSSIVLALLFITANIGAQTQPELERAEIKAGRIWLGVTANGDKGSFDYRAGFFPNDYDILGVRGQQLDAWAGAGFDMATTMWTRPDSIIDYTEDPVIYVDTVAVYGPVNKFQPTGKVVVPMTNYVRYRYTPQVLDFDPIELESYGVVDPDKFGDYTCDQLLEVTSQNVLGVQIHRKILAWSQNYNDDYVIVDVVFTNVSDSTLKNFYISVRSNGENTIRSNGAAPSPAGGERFSTAITWQHYYGGRVGDSLRVFYEYSANDPVVPFDNMGAPSMTKRKLFNPNFIWYAILHASEQPFTDPANDRDDFLQPKVTYFGKDNIIPYNSANDEFGSKNFWAIRGGFSEYYPMSGNTWPETFHGANTDELGDPNYSAHLGVTNQGNNSKMWSSFGPYTFEPGQSLHIVYASGYTGLSIEKAKEIGEKWVDGTLDDPPGIPNARTGFFPENFAFPSEATDIDLQKDRWVSTGVDSVMKSVSRAKWNFEHDYKIPQAPPPPSEVNITGLGTGVEIRWKDADAEALPNFAGYRIMQRISNTDTVFYEQTFATGPDLAGLDRDDQTGELLYVHKNVLIGAQYYFYIQAMAQIDSNDPNADPGTRGKMLYSSRLSQPNIDWIKPPSFSQDDLSKIRVVPNPYNINDELLVRAFGFTDRRSIQFMNLPQTVTIKIFTETGDLVQTIEHDSPVSDGSADWDMLTRNQHVISSGVYIVVFEKPSGEMSFQKFLVVR